MRENYYQDKESSIINAILAATAWDLKKITRKFKSLFDFFAQMLYCYYYTRDKIIPYAI